MNMKRKLLLLVALLAVTLAAWMPASTQACTFCNLTGYSVCDSLDGTSCGCPARTGAADILPACACERGVCHCNADGTWHCVY